MPRSAFNQVADLKNKRSSAALRWCERFLCYVVTHHLGTPNLIWQAWLSAHTCTHRWVSPLTFFFLFEQACPRARVNILLCFRGLQNNLWTGFEAFFFCLKRLIPLKAAAALQIKNSINFAIFLNASKVKQQGLADWNGQRVSPVLLFLGTTLDFKFKQPPRPRIFSNLEHEVWCHFSPAPNEAFHQSRLVASLSSFSLRHSSLPHWFLMRGGERQILERRQKRDLLQRSEELHTFEG